MARQPLLLLLISSLFFSLYAQELNLSTSARTYTNGEQVWVNISVLDATTMPGAYKIALSFNASQLSYLNTLPAEKRDEPYLVVGADVFTPRQLVDEVKKDTEIGRMVAKTLDKGRLELARRKR